jgi:hypothetical protein
MRAIQSTVSPWDRHMPAKGWPPRSTTLAMRVQVPPPRFPHVVARHPFARHPQYTDMTNRIQHLFEERAESPRCGPSVLAGPRRKRERRPASLGPGLKMQPARAPTRARRHTHTHTAVSLNGEVQHDNLWHA